MVINYFNVKRIIVSPAKNNSPLNIDSNTVIFNQFTFKFFQMVCRRNSQIINVLRIVNHSQFPSGNILNFIWQLLRSDSIPNKFGLFVAKFFDHLFVVTLIDTNAKGM